MNTEEVFALLQRADPVRQSDQEVHPMPRHVAQPRSRWVRPLLIAAAAALAAVVAIGPFALLGGDDGEVVDTVASTVVPPPDESTPTSPVSTSTSAPVPSGTAPLFVADGAQLFDLASNETLMSVPAVILYDDLAGGVVYQTESPFFGGLEGTDVWHREAGSLEPVPLMRQDGDATLRLMGVFAVEERPTAIVVERQNPGDVENATEIMYEVDLETGDVRQVAPVGGWESGPAAISWDGSGYVLSSLAEGYSFLATLDRDGTETPWTGALPPECYDEPECARVAVATPDGTKLVFTRGLTSERTTLVLWDRATDQEIWAVELGAGSVLGQPASAGDTIVVNRYLVGEPGIGFASIVDLQTAEVGEAGVRGFADVALQPVASMAEVTGPEAQLSDWLGVYEWAEPTTESADGSPVSVNHILSLGGSTVDDVSTTGTLSNSGPDLDERLAVEVTAVADRIRVTFVEYLDGAPSSAGYRPGDVLLEFSGAPGGPTTHIVDLETLATIPAEGSYFLVTGD